jgi:hypothetical protein
LKRDDAAIIALFRIEMPMMERKNANATLKQGEETTTRLNDSNEAEK